MRSQSTIKNKYLRVTFFGAKEAITQQVVGRKLGFFIQNHNHGCDFWKIF